MTSAGQHLKFPYIINALLTIIFILCHTMSTWARSVPSSDIVVQPKRLQSPYTDTAFVSECSKPPRNSCSFYPDCLEVRYHCGPAGYPLGYGEKFCQKFSVDRTQLSLQGQKWMLDTMQCLQNALVPEATGSGAGVTCGSIKAAAFGTHAACYVGNGLCGLPPSDWLAIVGIVQFKTLFESWDAFLATLKTAGGCLEFHGFLAQVL
jgi:hypothetical protein